MILVFSLAMAYLIGSFPTSFIFARVFSKIDIRQHGSGNVGATNVYRVVGKLPGLAVLVIDVLKGVFCVTVIPDLFAYRVLSVDPGTFKILLGAAVIAGHVWTVFLGFKGGKGVATTAGVIAVIAPKIFIVGLIVWLVTFFLSRYVSLASIASALSMPVSALFLNKSINLTVFVIILCILGVYKHKSNIRRLLRGEENKLK